MNDETRVTDTRESLIEIGRKLFSANGFDGTSVRDITTAAGANLGAVTYHFGSKEGLYEAVVSATVAPLAERLVTSAGGPGDPMDRVEAVVREYFGYLTDHPEMPRLFIRSLLASGMPPGPAVEHLKRILAALVQLIREGQGMGAIRPGHPVLMSLGLMSYSLHLTLMRPALARMAGFDLDDPAQRDVAIDHVVLMVRGGLSPRQEGPA